MNPKTTPRRVNDNAPDTDGPKPSATDGPARSLPFGPGASEGTTGDTSETTARPISPEAPPIQPPEPDPWDLKSLRVPQDFASALGVRRVWTTIPFGKPRNTWFVRASPDPEHQLSTLVLELKDEREHYLVSPGLWAALATEPTVSTQLIVTSVNRQGVPFLWPVKLPGHDGKTNPWHESAMEALRMARDGWVRIYANMGLGAYEVHQATGDLTEPRWPDLSFRELLKLAFQGRMISEWEHPVLRRLRGEI